LADQRDRDQVGVVVRCSLSCAHLHGAVGATAPGKPCTAATTGCDRRTRTWQATRARSGRKRGMRKRTTIVSPSSKRQEANSNVRAPSFKFENPAEITKWNVRAPPPLPSPAPLARNALRVASHTHHDAYTTAIAGCAGFARSDGSVHVRCAGAEARVAGNLTILTAAHATLQRIKARSLPAKRAQIPL
jgi:hypothetical protein